MHVDGVERPLDRRWLQLLVVAWVIAVATAFVLFWRYKAMPGSPAEAPTRWPAPALLPRTPGLPALVMFAHPECPCTKASLEELAVVMSRVRGKVDAWVLLVRPPGTAAGFEDTETRERAEQIAGVQVRVDVDGRLAEQFGVRVSGQVLLYSGSGALRFAGGITGVRGHVGDNVGRRRLLSLIELDRADAATAHVFGCELFSQARD